MTTLSEIRLQVRDVQAAANWYATHLHILPLDEAGGRVTLDVAPVPIVLEPAHIQLAMSSHLGWGAEFCVTVDDLEMFYAAARAADCVKEPLMQGADGIDSFVFSDLNGYRLRVREAA